MKPVKEAPLVLLTIFTQASIGLSLWATFFIYSYPDGIYLFAPAIPGVALVILTAGLISSIFHLGHPLGGIRSMTNLKFSWLSREILAFGAYGASLAIDLVLQLNGVASLPIQVLVCLCGIVALYTSSMIYQNSGYPALNNFIPLLSFVGTSMLLGLGLLDIGFLGFFVMSTEVSAVLGQILFWVLIIFTVIHFLIPVYWLTGNQVMRTTAINHYRSILFWIRGLLLIGAIGLFVISNQDPTLWVFRLIFIGEVIGRILFFNHMVHASNNIGRPYT
jgi:DMSO reductase anchor subunit